MLTFGEVIRERREALNLSLREVALCIKIDPSLLGKIERNERRPTSQQIDLIGNYLKIDKNKLIITFISDQIASTILETSNEMEILRVAKKKAKFLKYINENNTTF